MPNETFRNRLEQAKFFAIAALLLVTLTLFISGTPGNAAGGDCVLKVTNTTNFTAYWGQPIVIGINVTNAQAGLTGGGAFPAGGAVMRLNLTCANSTLCTTETLRGAPLTATLANDTTGGIASITVSPDMNPRYSSAALPVGSVGGPLSPGRYETSFSMTGGTGCAQLIAYESNSRLNVSIKGYYPFITVSNIVNGSSTIPEQGNLTNITFTYTNTTNALIDQAKYLPNLTQFNFTIGDRTVRTGESIVFSAFNNQTGWLISSPTGVNFTVAPNTRTVALINTSWTRDRVYVNITATTQDGWYVSYANTTINYINIQLNKNDGTPFTGNAFLWKLNGTTKLPMIPAGWGLNDPQDPNVKAPPFLPLTAGTFTINCYDPESRCYDSNRPTGMYSVSGSILGLAGQTTGVMASELENAAVNIVAYDMASSNMTDTWTITPYSNDKAINLTLNNSGSMSQFSVRTLSQMQGPATLISMRIYDSSGMVYSVNTSRTGEGAEFERSVPLKLGTNYSIEVEGREESFQPFTRHNITYTPVFNGFGGALILVWNSTVSSYTTVKGQVLSQFAGARNVTVYAEPRECHAGGPFVSACIVNSTLTDSSGLFEMKVPIIPGMNEYKLTAADARRNDGGGRAYSGALIHYPTKDDNNGRYYQAQGALLVAPPINMTYAGTMSLSVNITPNVFGVMTELSRLRLLATGWVRDNFVNRMAMANVFGFMTTAAPITSITFPMDSPTNGSSTVNLFFWGMGVASGAPGPNNQPNVIMGERNTNTVQWRSFSQVTANTTTQGNLVLRVSMCNRASIFSQSGACTDAPAALNPMATGAEGGNYWNFWWNSKVVIYTGGNYSQPYQYLEGSEDSMFLSRGKIPLMPGTYGIEIASKYDWNKPLSQNRMINFTITRGVDTNLTVYVFSPGWDIRSQTFPYTMRRTEANILNVSVFDLAQPSGLPLNQTSKLNMTFQAVNVNGTPAMAAINMTWANITSMGGGNPFESFLVNFTPFVYGLPAGKYIGLFRANLTNYTINPFGSADITGSCTSATASCQAGYYADLYITSQPWQYQFVISDFDIGAEPYKRTFIPGETIKATLYGFNNTDSNGLNGTVATYIYNEGGKLVNSTNETWDLANMVRYNMSYGIANLSIPAPATVGWYELLSVVNVTAGRGQGVLDGLNGTTNRGWALSDMWVKVSNFGFEDKYDKRSYATSDPVKLGITLTNGTAGSAISNAAITAFVDQDQTPIFALTDAKGRATFQLTRSGGWSYGGHNVRMAVNAFNSSGNNEVINEEFFSWFDVGGIDVNFYPTKSKYTIAENVTVNVYSSSVSNAGAFTLYIDGNETQVTWTPRGTNYWTATTTIAGQWLPGRHFMQLKVGSGSGSASFFAGFETSAVNLMITMNKTDYSVGDGAGAIVKIVNATTMLPAANLLATGRFYKQSAGSNKLIATTSNWTTPSGIVLLNATIQESGYYLLEVLTAGQRETATFRASGMNVTVASLGGDSWSAGQMIQYRVQSVAQLTVEPILWAYGEKLTLPANTTDASGTALVSYTLPSDAPGGTYTLDVKVTTNTSVMGFNTTTFKVGSYNIQLSSGKSFVGSFRQGESTKLTATVRNDTSPVANLNVTFAIGGKTVTDTTKGTALTDATGKAVLSTTVPSADDFYYAKAYVTDSPEVTAYAPVVVASLNVTLTTINGTTGLPTDRFVYSAAGDVLSVLYNVTVRTQTGSIVNLTDGSTTGGINILLFSKEGGEISQPFGSTIAPTSDGRYSLNTTLPNITGSFAVVGMVRANNSMGFDIERASLNTANLIMNITTSTTNIIANQTDFNVTVNVFNYTGGGQTGTVAVTIFSPTGGGTPIYYNPSFPFGTAPSNYVGVAHLNISATNITYPGIYIVKAEFTSGANKISNYTLLRVSTGTRLASLDVSSITSTTATITSNVPNATAYVMKESAGRTTTMALPLVPSGSNYYTLATDLTSGTTYFVRLDNTNSTGVNTTMFRTS